MLHIRKAALAAVVAAVTALAPAGVALAQEVGDGAEPPTDTTETVDDGTADDVDGDVADESAFALFSVVVDALAAAMDAGSEAAEADDPTTDEDDAEVLAEVLAAMMVAFSAEFSDGDADDGENIHDADDGEDVDGTEAVVEEEDDDAHGELVSMVAQCAPNGQDANGLIDGVHSHGAIVSAAARGALVTVDVPVLSEDADGEPVVEEGEAVAFDLTVMTDAEAFCDALDVLVEARHLLAEIDDGDDGSGRGSGRAKGRTGDTEQARAEGAGGDFADGDHGRGNGRGNNGR